MSGRRTRRVRVTRIDAEGTSTTHEDALAVEEPLEIRINGKPFSVTMRSPGDDFDLMAGSGSPKVSSGPPTTCRQCAIAAAKTLDPILGKAGEPST